MVTHFAQEEEVGYSAYCVQQRRVHGNLTQLPARNPSWEMSSPCSKVEEGDNRAAILRLGQECFS